VVTSTLVFEGDGRLGDYVGGYTDWQNEKKKMAARKAEPAKAQAAAPKVAGKPAKKLSGREQKELETLPAKIEALEQEQAELTAKLADPSFYKKEAAKFAEVKKRLEIVEREHATAFARWEELEAARTSAS
jgi:ATP-binding cassette subfamily F protein uup